MGKHAIKSGWHAADIVAAVRKNGSSLVGISAALGLTRSAASRALIKPHPRVNRAIAGIVGVHESVLWPHWFDASGRRIGAGSRSRSPHGSQTQQAGVAAAFQPVKDAA